jgi:hypothetical protein
MVVLVFGYIVAGLVNERSWMMVANGSTLYSHRTERGVSTLESHMSGHHDGSVSRVNDG